jgi:hypothetical protein
MDEIWEVEQWQESRRTDKFYGSFPVLRPDAAYLASLRYKDVGKSVITLSPRMAAFVESAKPLEVERPALLLACIIDCGAATFNPTSISSAAGQDPECPMMCLVRILEDVKGFLKRANNAANTAGTRFDKKRLMFAS